MQRFFKENFWWLILIAISIVAIISVATLPNENWFRRLILSPFILVGVLTIWGGCLAMAEQFEKYAKKDWQKTLIFAISMFGVVAFFMRIN